MYTSSTITINDGTAEITKSYEGIESAVNTINGGDINIIASDDGIHLAGGNDGLAGWGPGGGMGPGGGFGKDAFAASKEYYLAINGVDAGGDGIDANGTIVRTDGDIIVNGPTEKMNGALDFASFNISGGFLVTADSSGMSQVPGEQSSQNSLPLNFTARSRMEPCFIFGTLTAAKNISTLRQQRITNDYLLVGTSYSGGSSSGTRIAGL